MLPPDIEVVTQGEIVAQSLSAYLKRHPEMEARISKGSEQWFFTTGETKQFDQGAALFWGALVASTQVDL
jgi:glutamate racemase